VSRIWCERLLVLAWAALLGGCGSEVVNGCRAADAQDARGVAEVEIAFGGVHGYHYAPACVRVTAGTRIRFRGPFEVHPLGVGALVDGAIRSAPGSPLRETAEGEEATSVLAEPGAYGFFCHMHVVEGMAGAVFVE
jgi:plastocyanin